jgi:phage gp16-like protein
MLDRKKLALIHIIKKELNLSDEEYRAILHQAAGVRSAKDLTEEKFRKLMSYFVRSQHSHINRHGMTIRQKFFIQGLVRQMEWSQDHWVNFLHKYYRVRRLEDLTKEQASHTIESLKHTLENRHHSRV